MICIILEKKIRAHRKNTDKYLIIHFFKEEVPFFDISYHPRKIKSTNTNIGMKGTIHYILSCLKINHAPCHTILQSLEFGIRTELSIFFRSFGVLKFCTIHLIGYYT